MHIRTIKIDIVFDIRFWALLPVVNINLHSHEFELEWLCFGAYFGKQKNAIEQLINNKKLISYEKFENLFTGKFSRNI